MPIKVIEPVAANVTDVPCPKCKAQSEIFKMENSFADDQETVHTSTTRWHRCLNPGCQNEFVKTAVIGAKS